MGMRLNINTRLHSSFSLAVEAILCHSNHWGTSSHRQLGINWRKIAIARIISQYYFPIIDLLAVSLNNPSTSFEAR